MVSIINVTVPDIGNVDNVTVIEVQVAAGDTIKKEQSIVTLESDKASMEIPSPQAGKVQSVNVKLGDKIKQNDLLITLEVEGATESAQKVTEPLQQTQQPEVPQTQIQASKPESAPSAQLAQVVRVPDIGNFDKVDVIEVPIKVGMTVKKNQTLVVLESDKASMEIPSPLAGVVQEIAVKVGDKVAQDSVICNITSDEQITSPAPKQTEVKSEPAPQMAEAKPAAPAVAQTSSQTDSIYASPGVRRLARELNIDLKTIKATGEKGRITKDDLNQFIKNRMQSGGGGSALGIEPMPIIDFAQFGPVEFQELSRIKKLSAKFLHRNWVNIPHVTQFDEVDITDLEEFRQQNKAKFEERGVKLTPLVFLMKASVAALKKFPTFNASLQNDQLVLKKYFHIGVAVDTPNGLVVPVVRDVNLKGFMEIAEELKTLSDKARAGQLTAKEMQGSSFTISSLGGIGGTAFTPIINAPDVAILGASKSRMMPVYQNGTFIPRLMLPLSLSYDHRVIDGAEGARFITFLGEMLGDLRQMLL
ncbi:MAG: dihydrolipoyllysine-residue acetyltransferase [Gammaproteobacteria bacterium]